MPRRLLILPVVLVTVAALAWLAAPTIKNWLAPVSVTEQLRIGMDPAEVRALLGEPGARGFGTWRYGVPADRVNRGWSIYFDPNHRVCGWVELGTGVNVGGPGEVRPAAPARGPWP